MSVEFEKIVEAEIDCYVSIRGKWAVSEEILQTTSWINAIFSIDHNL